MSDQRDATGAIRVTDEMVERATTTYLENDDGPSASMRAALNVALALVPIGADFRAGAEWAAKLVEILAADRLGLPGRIACDAIHTALAALPEGGDGWRPIETAPKDGMTTVFLLSLDGKAHLGTWNPTGDSWVDEEGRPGCQHAHHLEETGNWSSGGGWFQPDEVSAWQPVAFPSPPSTQGSGT